MKKAAPLRDPGFGLYVHWPFCPSKCPYCDFNSYAASTVDHEAYVFAYLEALETYVDYRPSESLSSIYFGGGTPSLAKPDMIARIIARAGEIWDISGAEITIEANPATADMQKFCDFAQAGVNRISMGFQALDDRDLHELGRTHNVAEAWRALDMAQKHFDRINFDLIYARQNQTLESWQAELEMAIARAPDHLSLYQLTIEPGTIFSKRHQKGRLPGLPSDELAQNMYAYTLGRMNEAGFDAYEISNFARPDEQSRHNLVYWRYGDYIGIGPGAHGRLGGISTEQPKSPAVWLGDPGVCVQSPLDLKTQGEEYLMMAMRLLEGAELGRLAAYGVGLEGVETLCALGFVDLDDTHIRATAQGRFVLDRVLLELLA